MFCNQSFVPNAKEAMPQFKAQVMKQKGYKIGKNHPDDVKYEVAEEVGVPLKQGYNGHLTSKQAGKVGGNMGGPMVRELVKLAQNQLN